MKRDMDLARHILFAIEEHDGDPLRYIDLKISGRTDREVSYHVMLLGEARLVEVKNYGNANRFEYRPRRLTWEGHEFLDAVRDDTVWKRAKSETLAKTGQLTFEVIKATLMGLARQGLGLP